MPGVQSGKTWERNKYQWWEIYVKMKERKCPECQNSEFNIIESTTNRKGYRIVCSECGEKIDEIFKCVECNKSLSEDETKGYIKVYKDGQIEFYSVLCEKCKWEKGQEVEGQTFYTDATLYTKPTLPKDL